MGERQRGTAIGIERGRLETGEAQEGSSRARDRATEVAAGRGLESLTRLAGGGACRVQ
jgi:hypothetical protein